MRQSVRALALSGVVFAWAGACVTVNIYFPAPEVRAAAEEIVDETWGGAPSGQPGSAPAPAGPSSDSVPPGAWLKLFTPPFGSVPFDSGKVAETQLGTATVAFAHGNAATFAYTVSGASRSKAITPLVFVAPERFANWAAPAPLNEKLCGTDRDPQGPLWERN